MNLRRAMNSVRWVGSETLTFSPKGDRLRVFQFDRRTPILDFPLPRRDSAYVSRLKSLLLESASSAPHYLQADQDVLRLVNYLRMHILDAQRTNTPISILLFDASLHGPAELHIHCEWTIVLIREEDRILIYDYEHMRTGKPRAGLVDELICPFRLSEIADRLLHSPHKGFKDLRFVRVHTVGGDTLKSEWFKGHTRTK